MMDGSSDGIAVEHNPAANRYEVHTGDSLSVLEYRRDGDRIIFTHTGVPAEVEGRGIAAHLARAALDDARAQGLAVVPRCPYVAAYIRRHPEYLDLVPVEYRQHLRAAPDGG